jgi:hypothetical protein
MGRIIHIELFKLRLESARKLKKKKLLRGGNVMTQRIFGGDTLGATQRCYPEVLPRGATIQYSELL